MAKTFNNSPSCLFLDAHEERSDPVEPRTFSFGVIDAARRKMLFSPTANEFYKNTLSDVRRIKVSPDGRRVAYAGSDTKEFLLTYVGVYGATATLPRLFQTTSRSHGNVDFQWTPDSKWVIVRAFIESEAGNSFRLFAVDENGQIQTVPAIAGLEVLHTTRDGRFVSYNGQFVVWSAETPASARTLSLDRPFTSQGWPYPSLAWHPTQDIFAYVSRMDKTYLRLHVSTLEDKEVIAPITLTNQFGEDRDFEVVYLDWSPDGNYLIISYGGITTRYFHLIDVKHGGKVILEDRVTPNDCTFHCGWAVFAWKPDGSGVIFSQRIPDAIIFDEFFQALIEYNFTTGQKSILFNIVGEYRFLPNGWFFAYGVSEPEDFWVSAMKGGNGNQLIAKTRRPGYDGYQRVFLSPSQDTGMILGIRGGENIISWFDFNKNKTGFVPVPDAAVFKQWSPNGRAFAYEANHNPPLKAVWVLDTQTGRQARIGRIPSHLYQVQPSNNARLIAIAYYEYWTNTYALEIRDVQTAQV